MCVIFKIVSVADVFIKSDDILPLVQVRFWSCFKPLPEPMLTQVSDKICSHQATMT